MVAKKNQMRYAPAMNRTLLLLFVVGGIALGTGCTRYEHLVVKEDGKLLVTYSKGGFGFYEGGILECSRKGGELDCQHLYVLWPDDASAVKPGGPPEIVTDQSDLAKTAVQVQQWVGQTVAVHVTDGNLLTGSLTEVRGLAQDALLVLTTDKGPLAVRLKDTIRITVMQVAQ